MIASEAGFPYTNIGPQTESRFMLKLPKNKLEDDELGVFGAEKYFKGVIDEERLKPSNNGIHHYRSIQTQEKQEETYPVPKPKTPSVRSESSWNSRKGLLVSNGSNHSKKTSVKSLLANLGCNCCDKGSVKVTEVKEPVKSGDLGQKTKPAALSTCSWADDHENVEIKREECFTFPVMNPSSKDILESSRKGPQNDTGSDASSDLFEIESFSTNEINNSFLKQQVTEENNNLYLARQVTDNNNGYAPSEVSVDWSVVTASMADNLSTPEDNLVVSRNIVKGSGILSAGRCKSLKAVRISGDEHGKTGGEKVAVIVSPAAKREWCHRLDSATPVAKIQAGTKLKGAGSDSHRSHNRFGFTPRSHETIGYIYRGCLN